MSVSAHAPPNSVEALKNQLALARNEIQKLRQQMKTLQHVQRKDINEINELLNSFRCEGCRQAQAAEENSRNSNETAPTPLISEQPSGGALTLRPIGVIRTVFPEKRAVPRQPSMGSYLAGVLELNSDVFTNPEHALDGLKDYSHMWIIYHFHKNTAHPKAKVAPPRLGGERVGVFSTRSPHRPCPIGLSLVEIDKIDGATITFFGTDMVSETPVLDIKPYIPIYDTPKGQDSGRVSVGPLEAADFYTSRQDPDGEESELELLGAAALNTVGGNGTGDDGNQSQPVNFVSQASPPPTAVRVPNWVADTHHLRVIFNERAQAQLEELQVHRRSIVDILEADPRSVYLRTKYGSQIFTFQLREVTVTCKFDDKAATVTVVQIRRTENVQDEEVHEQ